MAEIVGLISAIGAIAAAGLKISRAIAAARDDFGTATANVNAIAIDAKAVAAILGHIRSHLIGRPGRVDSDTTELLDKIVARCEADIKDLQTSLLPLIENMNSAEPMNKRLRLRWLFAKSKICSQQAALGSLKLTLSLFMHALQLSDGFAVE